MLRYFDVTPSRGNAAAAPAAAAAKARRTSSSSSSSSASRAGPVPPPPSSPSPVTDPDVLAASAGYEDYDDAADPDPGDALEDDFIGDESPCIPAAPRRAAGDDDDDELPGFAAGEVHELLKRRRSVDELSRASSGLFGPELGFDEEDFD